MNYAYGTTAGSIYSISLSPTEGDRPKTPSGLIVTRAVETKGGWLGQILVDKDIVYQSGPCDDGDEAIKDANSRVVSTIKALFTTRSQRRE